ncbi:hypothetical protein N7539_000344 [Penicillium diatomitis]|uniref:Uncharacterized protein n=1 Tax=Penicillium diatomitis TaxID=2819901 RepID=A0A9W9XLK5_9EURO|nr:uncharacterized protein N7539_000344 [Penicillium diatomitis]KAJ5495228.1 hypothetical protein N7539_000344 [Penicillium diatomitis]
MATGFSPAPRKEGTWTKLTIFISLYCLILESIGGLVIVFLLYGRHEVDSKMAPSLILCMVASFLTVPLVSLQSLVAWQYNKIGGFGEQKTILHNICTYFFRLDLMVWLAASIAGLIVAAEQMTCLPAGYDGGYWKVGTSCVLHQCSVLVSVTAFVTVCTTYCARQLCDRPYDISLIGIYKRSCIARDGSIVSNQTWNSDETLKHEILNLCRQHDGKANEEPWAFDPLADKVKCHPSICHPAPVRLRPQLHVNTNAGSEYGEITSGTTVSPDSSLSRLSPSGQTLVGDFYPMSRTSTVTTSKPAYDAQAVGKSAAPRIPEIPAQFTANHKRGKSSLSSLRRFLPKSFPLSLPLSSDPQILALANPDAASDVEKQVVTPSTASRANAFAAPKTSGNQLEDKETSETTLVSLSSTESTEKKAGSHSRTMTMSSADAPEVVVSASQLKNNAAQPGGSGPIAMSIHHPHHPNYVPAPATSQRQRGYSASCRQNAVTPLPHTDSQRRAGSRPPHVVQHPGRRSSQSADRHIASPYGLAPYHANRYPHPHQRPAHHQAFDPSHSVPNLPRRDDVEVIYPSTRRPRSNTHGGLNTPLSCIFEAGSIPPMPMDEINLGGATSETRRNMNHQATYRGTNRTSMGFY